MRPSGLAPLVLAAASLAGPAGSAQRPDGVERLMKDPAVRAAMEAGRRDEPATIADQIRLCEIPAPPFMEAARAKAFADALRSVGLDNVRVDAEGNVLAERHGRHARPRLVVSAHLDTVFPQGTGVGVTRQGNVLRGPGIGDDCRGLAALLAVARALDAGRVETHGSITFVGTVGEEGLGDLRGVKALFDRTLKGQVDRFVSIDGDGHTITNVAVGSRRYRVTFRGSGGHSFDSFGVPNPIHALGRTIALVSNFEVPAQPRTTFSVGRIGGGTSVNAIAQDAWMEVDLRSIDPGALDTLEKRFRQAVDQALAAENHRGKEAGRLTVDVQTVGNRPAGRTMADSPIVQTAVAATRALGLPVRLNEGSTDANLAMSLGVPAITVGAGGSGSGAHTLQESFDTTDSWRGTQRMILLTISLSAAP